MVYRIHQFISAIFPNLDPSEITWALDNLPPEGCSLFLRQSSSEQRHSLDVAQSLIQEKNTLTLSNFQNLITAALLHDCGKSQVCIRLWHRVIIVLMQSMPKTICSRLERSHTIFATPIRIASQHAIWGGDLAQKAGLNPLICLLIREHHSPKTGLGLILECADKAN